MPVDVTKNWRWRRLIKSAAKYVCAPGSVRTKSPNKSTRIRFCCPKGYWNKKTRRCEVPTITVAKGSRR